MNRIIVIALALMVVTILALRQKSNAEEIHFNNNIYTLKYSALSPVNKGYENEYFPKDENRNNWTKMVGIYYYPEESNPIKFADKKSKGIESEEINVLLKYIENKKADKAAISYLQNGSCNDKNYFEYNIMKYEKHPTKGMMELRYAIRYFFAAKDEIPKIAEKVKSQNDEYLQIIIESPIPPIVEKDIN